MKTIQEFMEWCKKHPNTVIRMLPTDEWQQVDNWREAVAEHTTPALKVESLPHNILQAINRVVELFGTEVLNDIQATHDEF